MTFLLILAILGIVIGLMIYGAIASQKWHREHQGEGTMTEGDHFYGRLIYVNPDDKRIFVPKRTGGGFTMNFANPLSVIAGILVIGGFTVLIGLQQG